MIVVMKIKDFNYDNYTRSWMLPKADQSSFLSHPCWFIIQ